MLSISISSFFILSETMYQSVLYYVPTHTTNCSHGQICVLEFELNQPMSAPIYVLYQLDGFYQNHRRYIQSKSNYQLAGIPFIIKETHFKALVKHLFVLHISQTNK